MKNADYTKVRLAMVHVRSFFPNVDTVLFGTDARWLFMEGIEPVSFHGKDINVSILEDAIDSVDILPSVFSKDMLGIIS
jgi:hypothetical protein